MSAPIYCVSPVNSNAFQEGRQWFRCTIVVPYVDKSILYKVPGLKDTLTFEHWKKRPISFYFLGRCATV